MSSPISRVQIFGLHDQHDIFIDFNESLSIFMGPNGVGKSTVLNVIVNTLARQWSRLSKLPFERVVIAFPSGESASVLKSDCVDFVSGELPARTQQLALALSEEDLLDILIEGTPFSQEQVDQFETNTQYLLRDVRVFRNSVLQYGQALSALSTLTRSSKTIKANFHDKILYLPTYRRIEQELSEVLTMSSSNTTSFRRVAAEIQENVSNSSAIIELVRFGMDDITKLLEKYTSDIKEYSRQQINALSTRYLTAALRSRQHFDRYFFDALSETRIRDVLARVDDAELNASQRKGITDLVKSLQNRQGGGRLTRAQEHIAGYFQMLAETHDRISPREEPLRALARTLSKYLSPSKQVAYDPTRYEFMITSGTAPVPLAGLSSGEKQIVSLFTTLFLSPDQKLLVVIDEPELSLSVLWQELLLSDIRLIPSCSSVIAVTHSPFIYGESLAKFTRDLSDHIVKKKH